MSAIEIVGLEFAYDQHPVLHGVDLSVDAATVMAVIGPSGCGKTTLLRLVAGFERPATGRIDIGGRRVAGPGSYVSPDRRRVGIVPQEGALFPHLSVADNVGFALPRRTPGRDDRISELVKMIELEGMEARLPRELSGGQQQRVALARALASRPQVVMLDEPFASLDPDTRVAVRGSVREVLTEERATALLVTHDREEALSMADHVAVMLDGRIVQVAEPERAYDAPINRRVATLLGEATFLPVRGRRGAVVECCLGDLPVRDPATTGDLVMLRPEHLVLDPAGVEALVIDSQFVGPSTRLIAELQDGSRLTARLTGVRPRPGERIALGVTSPVHVLHEDRGAHV